MYARRWVGRFDLTSRMSKGGGGAAYEFTASGKMLKIVFDVPRRTTRNDIIFHASDKVLIAGLRVSQKKKNTSSLQCKFLILFSFLEK
jgi:hypothetical protein